jgi:hypothetical protein
MDEGEEQSPEMGQPLVLPVRRFGVKLLTKVPMRQNCDPKSISIAKLMQVDIVQHI